LRRSTWEPTPAAMRPRPGYRRNHTK
jgi:hypothetical protein